MCRRSTQALAELFCVSPRNLFTWNLVRLLDCNYWQRPLATGEFRGNRPPEKACGERRHRCQCQGRSGDAPSHMGDKVELVVLLDPSALLSFAATILLLRKVLIRNKLNVQLFIFLHNTCLISAHGSIHLFQCNRSCWIHTKNCLLSVSARLLPLVHLRNGKSHHSMA